MIDYWLKVLSNLIEESFWLTPIFAFLAGALTSLTPCALPVVPLIIGYVGGTRNNGSKKAFKLSLTFASGLAVTFTVLGTVASVVGKLLNVSGRWWYILLGILMVLMALQTWEVYNFVPSTYLTEKSTKKGYTGAFIAGILGGVFSSPCATPVLVVLLSIAARSKNIFRGILLLLFYSIGYGMLVVVAGTSLGFIRKITSGERYGLFSKVLKYIMGGTILLIALYMFYLGF